MSTYIDLPTTGVHTREEFESLPDVPHGWAWELRSGRLELTFMPVNVWHFRIVFLLLEHWLRRGYEISGEQYVADSGFVRGGTGKNNFVADGVVFDQGYRPAKTAGTHDVADIHAVIEAVSRDSEDHDAIEKLRVYAALGIPHYWIVRDTPGEDIDGLVTMYELRDGEYQLAGQQMARQLD